MLWWTWDEKIYRHLECYFLILQIVFGLLNSSQDTQFTFKFMFIFILGEHKLHFIPALIGPFLEVTLIPQPDLRNVMIPIFHDMMDWEQRRSGNFKQVPCAKLFIEQDQNSSISESAGPSHWWFRVENVATTLDLLERDYQGFPFYFLQG